MGVGADLVEGRVRRGLALALLLRVLAHRLHVGLELRDFFLHFRDLDLRLLNRHLGLLAVLPQHLALLVRVPRDAPVGFELDVFAEDAGPRRDRRDDPRASFWYTSFLSFAFRRIFS